MVLQADEGRMEANMNLPAFLSVPGLGTFELACRRLLRILLIVPSG